jgi:CubicO group peptidase (beta-lactamase class C family)
VGAARFSGAVLVAKDGAPVFTSAAGEADRERHVPNRLDTRFRNGSMNKMFTAVAVLSLVQAGKVALQEPLATYLPDYPDPSIARKVTIHQLLTHTAGTGDVFGPDLAAHRDELRQHRDYIARFGRQPLLFEPGARWMYSNYGFILLGAVIERVSGQSYYDYVRSHVYARAGMTDTGSEPEAVDVPRRAIGYMVAPDGRWTPNAPTLPYRGTAAGGGYTTVTDLMRFAAALVHHRLLDAATTQLMLTGRVEGAGGRYGYGFIEHVSKGVRSVGHGGNAPGMDGDLQIFPDSGYVVAVLANVDPPAAQRVSEFIGLRVPAR